jgi:CheY-specific phosphatase CheX/anti-anti-sigma regulatory factor
MSLFISKTDRGCMIIGVPSAVETLALKHFTLFSAKWLENNVAGYIFDFNGVTAFDKQGYALFKKFKQDAQASKRPVFSTNVSKEMKTLFVKDGVDLLFNICESTTAAFKNLGIDVAPSKKIDVSVINVLIEIVGSEIKKSVQMDVTRGTPYIKKEVAFEGQGLIGIISLSGPSVRGLVRLLIPEAFGVNLHKHMYGEATDKISDEIVNYVDEFTTQIFTRIKLKLSEGGIEVGEAFPSIFVGKPSDIVSSRQEVSIIVPFEAAVGKFYLEVVTSA